MRMSEAARRQLVEASEGLRLKAYRDCVGVLSCGFGHTSAAGDPPVRADTVWTEAQADDVLTKDLRLFEQAVWDLVKDAKGGVAQQEFDALVDLAFNVGVANLKSSSLLRAYLAGNKQLAADKFLQWDHAGGRRIYGLTLRRERDRKWFLSGNPSPQIEPPKPKPVAPIVPPSNARVVDHADNWLQRLVTSFTHWWRQT